MWCLKIFLYLTLVTRLRWTRQVETGPPIFSSSSWVSFDCLATNGTFWYLMKSWRTDIELLIEYKCTGTLILLYQFTLSPWNCWYEGKYQSANIVICTMRSLLATSSKKISYNQMKLARMCWNRCCCVYRICRFPWQLLRLYVNHRHGVLTWVQCLLFFWPIPHQIQTGGRSNMFLPIWICMKALMWRSTQVIHYTVQ